MGKPKQFKKGPQRDKKRKRSEDDDGSAAVAQTKAAPPSNGPPPKVNWKRVKVKNIELQETGFFGLEELHVDGDPKAVDWSKLIKAPAAPSDMSAGDRAKFKYVDDWKNVDEDGNIIGQSDDEAADAVEDENVENMDAEDNVASDAEENVEEEEEQEQEEAPAQSGSAEEQEDADAAETENNGAEEQVETVQEEKEEEQPMTPEELEAAAPWKEAFEKLHPTILRGLREAGFTEPTAIQKEVMKPALLARKDVIGAAETGSGKTLAFIIPILQQIMELVEKYRNKKHAQLPKDIMALVLAPTRELAMQIVEHAKAISAHTPVRVVPLIGGIAVPKQERLLKKGAHILVATTGRLWEFLTEAHEAEVDFTHLRWLVLDEADKMIETGRFQELQNILRNVYTAKKIDLGEMGTDDGFEQPLDNTTRELIQKEDDGQMHLPPKPLQTFIFSATMTLSEESRRNLRKVNSAKNKKKQENNKASNLGDSTGILDKLMSKVQFQRTIELVDLTTTKIVAAKIEEAKIHCLPEEKDIYLYYFLERYKGRTIVFVNAISNIKRIVPLLNSLRVPAWPMHAAMQQRQRLKNLDRFKTRDYAVIVATDVMARGLDIPKVDHVVHYQIPPTAELYVHRSGRTARAQASGLSLCIVDPVDKKNWSTIAFTLKKDDVKEFPVDLGFYSNIKKRVETARKLDKLLHEQQKERQKRAWLHKAANDMELDVAEVDDDDGPQDDAAIKQAAVDRKRMHAEVGRLKAELQYLLDRPLVPEGTSSKYFTKTTFLALKDRTQHAAQEDLKQKGKISKMDRKRIAQRKQEDAAAAAKSGKAQSADASPDSGEAMSE